jgi:hypothetical protein
MSSTYGNRISELNDLLAQLPAAANDTINQNFSSLVKQYADLRQSAMNDLLDLMTKASASNLGTQSKSPVFELTTRTHSPGRRAT